MNPGAKIGYKVLKEDNYSAILGQFGVKYKKDKWVYPEENCGPLSVFISLEAASNFKKRYLSPPYNLNIIECEYIPSNTHKLWNCNLHNKAEEVTKFPDGTDFADKVRII